MARPGRPKRRASDDSPLFEPGDTPKKLRLHESDKDEGDGGSSSDGSDDSDGSGSDSEDGVYNESVEPYPPHAAYDDEIEDVTSALVSVAREAEEMFSTFVCDTPEVRELRDNIRDVSSVPDYERPTIGLLGEAGQGKSSLVNSLSDCPGLAKALEIGKSCTFVVFEYGRAGPKQRKNFSATIECFDLPTIGKILSSALDDWELFHKGDNDGWTQDDHQIFETKALTCLSVFRAIFCGTDYFKTVESATETLHHLTNVPREEATSGWVDDAATALDNFKGLVKKDGKYTGYFETDDTEALWAGLDRYVSESLSDGQPSHWPLIKKVTIGVAHSRLLETVTLVDMPGICDTNQVRVDTTLQYVNKCDRLFIVCAAGRVITNTVVNNLLQKYSKAFKGNVAVVATRCGDGVNHAGAVELEAKGFDIGNYHALKASSDLMSARVKELKGKRKKFRKGKGDHGKLTDETSTVEANREKIEASRWESVVAARNQHIVKNVIMERSRHMPAKKKLQVFCVSNKHYDIHKGAEEGSKFLLSAKGTGIPNLRLHTLLLAAPRMLGAIEDYVHHRFEVFLAGYDMWASEKAILTKERDALRRIVQQPRGSFAIQLARYHSTLEQQVESTVVAPLQDTTLKHATHAVGILQNRIKPLHWCTISAYARRKGNFKNESWNNLFTEDSTKVMAESWEFFIPRQESLAVAMEDSVVDGVNNLVKELKDQPAAASLPMKAFEEAMKGRIVAIRQIFKSRQETFDKEIRKTYIDATIDGPDNFFAEAMTEAYDLCESDSGNGLKARCLGYIQAHLLLTGDRSPFAAMANSVKDSIGAATTAQTTGLIEDLNSTFDLITKDFQTMTRKKSDDRSEVPVRDGIKKFLETASPAFEKARAKLAEIKARYPADV